QGHVRSDGESTEDGSTSKGIADDPRSRKLARGTAGGRGGEDDGVACDYSVDDTERGGRAKTGRQFEGEENRAWFRQIRERSSRACESVFLYAENDETDETTWTDDEGNAVHEEIAVKSLSANESSDLSSYSPVVLESVLFFLKVTRSFLEHGAE